jgi:hypothetical protein
MKREKLARDTDTIDACMAAIEVVDNRYGDFHTLGPPRYRDG